MPEPIISRDEKWISQLTFFDFFLSLVAIHGHGGHWERSWTDRDSGVFWLRDFLPERWPESRVLSYGYDASSALAIYVEDIAADLVVKLARLRGETGVSEWNQMGRGVEYGMLMLL